MSSIASRPAASPSLPPSGPPPAAWPARPPATLELELSLLACLALTGGYVVYSLLARPAGGHPIGHWLGVIGAGLMLCTETVYSLRKRARWLGWAGPLRYWLAFHIFTGLVGPFMVLLHTAFEFRGFAGFTLALTALVVLSGFLGRYFYTAIPRSLAGAEATAAELSQAAEQVQASLAALAGERSEAVRALVEADAARPRARRGAALLVLLRGWDDWRYRRMLRARVQQVERAERRRLTDVEQLLARRRSLERQTRTLEAARRLLALWHIAHVPMGLALFGSIAIHIAATLYYGAWP